MNICIVAHYAYGALTGEGSGRIGGVERQTALFASWLVKRGHHVSVITWHEGGENIEYINKIKVIKLCRITDGFPIFRFLIPRWTSLIKALRQANADIYYHNCAEYVTGQIAFWCRVNKRVFIYTAASDADCEIQLPYLKFQREKYLFRYGIKNANLVITQTVKQKKLLLKNYAIEARVINMPGTPPVYDDNFDADMLFVKQKVIWVGRLHKVKRIEWLIQIARQLTNITFEVIGPVDGDSVYIDSVLQDLNNTENITYLGKVSRSNMPYIYQNCSLLCSTSIAEGFPNTYLEAWSYGVPVVVTIDPDNIIKKNKLGYQEDNWSMLVKQIQFVLSNRSTWQKLSRNCRYFYRQHHSQDQVMEEFEGAFMGQLLN